MTDQENGGELTPEPKPKPKRKTVQKQLVEALHAGDAPKNPPKVEVTLEDVAALVKKLPQEERDRMKDGLPSGGVQGEAEEMMVQGGITDVASLFIADLNMTGLTNRQTEVLLFVQMKIESEHIPPTIREIGAYFGIASTNGVMAHLRALARQRRATAKPTTARASPDSITRIRFEETSCES